jgi:anti-sigma28 factor (negative regulator of flagellin synthesis)
MGKVAKRNPSDSLNRISPVREPIYCWVKKIMINIITTLLLIVATAAVAEDGNSITIDMSGQTFGYEIKSTDFEKNPERQIVVTIRNGKEVAEIKARIKNGEYTEEWLVLFSDAKPKAVHIRKWKALKFEGEDVGEALIKVATFFAKDGKLTLDSKGHDSLFKELLVYSKKQAEPDVDPNP